MDNQPITPKPCCKNDRFSKTATIIIGVLIVGLLILINGFFDYKSKRETLEKQTRSEEQTKIDNLQKQIEQYQSLYPKILVNKEAGKSLYLILPFESKINLNANETLLKNPNSGTVAAVQMGDSEYSLGSMIAGNFGGPEDSLDYVDIKGTYVFGKVGIFKNKGVAYMLGPSVEVDSINTDSMIITKLKSNNFFTDKEVNNWLNILEKNWIIISE